MLACMYCAVALADGLHHDASMNAPSLFWQSEKAINEKNNSTYSRAIIANQYQDMLFILDYAPEQQCRLTQAKILLLSKEPQPAMLPISVFGKMQIDDDLVHTIELEVTSNSGDPYITLRIHRPDLDQLLFRGKQVSFHLNNYGFMNFSLKGYQDAIKNAIPTCEQLIKANSPIPLNQ